MNYYIDTEFCEGFKKPIKWLPTIGRFNKPYWTIQLISIGVVAEDGREYYAISKDFDLSWAWNSWQPRTGQGDRNNREPKYYWLRENVLDKIYGQNLGMGDNPTLNYGDLRYMLKDIGKSNKDIASEIKEFVYQTSQIYDPDAIGNWEQVKHIFPVDFFAYYADYDWVVFCTLFGKMINLPKGFPMYCRDLKQTEDEAFAIKKQEYEAGGGRNFILSMKNHPEYPRQGNEHNALDDAKWNLSLYNFLQSL